MSNLQTELDFITDDKLAGFRLHRFELLNWGTFDKHIWKVKPDGENALLTGDIGSGKSTVVDALTTLLVPTQKITYNKAAGAEAKERNLNSYVRGHYKSEKDAENLAAKQVALRDINNYSVLLGYFYNAGYDTHVTIAQVFWCKEDQNQPARFYCLSTEALNIAEHFSQFGSDILDLKKRLKRRQHLQLFESFKDYSAEFRRRLGIESEQALELLYQTVSMKAVGNLTEFVRTHMLEAPPVQERITSICREFENLNRAHEAVLKAKDQLTLLKPMLDDYAAYQINEQQHRDKTRCREALDAFFAQHKTVLLQQRIDKREIELEKQQKRLERQNTELSESRIAQQHLKQSIEDNGGRRLDEIGVEIGRLEKSQQQRKQQAVRYQGFCQQLELGLAKDSDSFHDNRLQAESKQQGIEEQQTDVDKQKIDSTIALNEHKQQETQLQEEINSLKKRQSNIPLNNLRIRQQLAETIGVAPEELPFIGELLKVDESQNVWEGAIERVMHNFGLSLLVAEEHYQKVAHYVEKTHLKGRLVYFRVKEQNAERFETPAVNSLFHKLRIKNDSVFYDWLAMEIARRFDYYCADTLEDFRRQPKAITPQGQVKSGASRHEKDDRHAINDRSRFILGWDNKAKIAALQQTLLAVQREGLACFTRLGELDKQYKLLTTQRDKARDLLNIEQFEEIDWQSISLSIDKLLDEKIQIEQKSDILKHLQKQLEESVTQLIALEEKISALIKEGGKLEAQIEEDKHQFQVNVQMLNSAPLQEREFSFAKLQEMQPKALPEVTLSIANASDHCSVMRKWVQNQINAEMAKIQRLSERIIKQMQQYKDKYKLESRDLDVALESAFEFGEMLEKLEKEDLPRHEKRFHQMLKEGTIQKIAMFQANLDKERQEIEDKLTKINRSLNAIDYNTGTYITLISERSKDVDIRGFQQDLRACLTDTLGGEDDLYDESKFHQVKKLIDRFSGREGLTDADKKWTRKVTDVRNWFLFSASERWREDDTEKEYYSDSAGKSGGQKEKLAYTILASALAYQFGLEWGETQSKSFRFVMIDEAFGRGSDDSARYGLELFSKLNLQLLIVTPLQKIHVIENYVKSVNLVHNEGGKNSMLRNLTIEEYHREKFRMLTDEA
ncbi:MAG: ATP-dependent exonuclease SbcCD, C subunit-like protein [Gammaproteobacteria bacterium]|nr:MAG: ATP-dependent exonuclease SbcCD, C subunit-like protein [Gammaproteobacteria bacterium]